MVQPDDRRALERAGWRTTLDYRENHIRGRDGRLLEVVPSWTAEAERFDGDLAVASANGTTADEAWAHLRDDVEAGRTTDHDPAPPAHPVIPPPGGRMEVWLN